MLDEDKPGLIRVALSFLLFILMMCLLTKAASGADIPASVSNAVKIQGDIYSTPDANKEQIKDFIEAYEKIPPVVRALLHKKDIRIYITPYASTDPENATTTSVAWPTLVTPNPKSDTIAEVTRTGWIICHTGLPQRCYNPEQLVYTAGIMFDNMHSYMDWHYTGSIYGISDSDSWQAIYNPQNANALRQIPQIDELASLNWPLTSHDGYADAFRLYACHPDELRAASEEVYNYIDQTLKRAKDYYHMNYGAIPDTPEETKTARLARLRAEEPNAVTSATIPAKNPAGTVPVNSSANETENTDEITEEAEDMSTQPVSNVINTIQRAFSTATTKAIIIAVLCTLFAIAVLIFAWYTIKMRSHIARKAKRQAGKSKLNVSKKLPLGAKLIKKKEKAPSVKQTQEKQEEKIQKVQEKEQAAKQPAPAKTAKPVKEKQVKQVKIKKSDFMSQVNSIPLYDLEQLVSKTSGLTWDAPGLYHVINNVTKTSEWHTSESIFKDARDRVLEGKESQMLNAHRAQAYWKVRFIPLQMSNLPDLQTLDKYYSWYLQHQK